MKCNPNCTKISLLVAVLFFSFLPFVSTPIALAAGIFLSLFIPGIAKYKDDKISKYLLQISIVLMGFGMNLNNVVAVSQKGFVFTLISVISVLIAGILAGKLLKVDHKISVLIASGTAICGGSAIAAVSPVIKAKNDQISFALAVVFVLNAIALFIFPYIGHLLNVPEEAFGYWIAIAIHDTSSVVGAGASYGAKALEIATTVKLTRTLWIIPLTFAFSFLNYGKDKSGKKIKIPWFIFYFILVILFSHYFSGYKAQFDLLHFAGIKGMTAALFFIGLAVTKEDIKKVGPRAFILGILLWAFISIISFAMIIM